MQNVNLILWAIQTDKLVLRLRKILLMGLRGLHCVGLSKPGSGRVVFLIFFSLFSVSYNFPRAESPPPPSPYFARVVFLYRQNLILYLLFFCGSDWIIIYIFSSLRFLPIGFECTRFIKRKAKMLFQINKNEYIHFIPFDIKKNILSIWL